MPLEELIQSLSAKIQVLQRSFLRLEKENKALLKKLEETESALQEREALAESLVQRINVLQLNRGDLEETEKRALLKKINGYLVDIDRCIEILNQ